MPGEGVLPNPLKSFTMRLVFRSNSITKTIRTVDVEPDDLAGVIGMAHIVERGVGTFHHGQTLLLSESGKISQS